MLDTAGCLDRAMQRDDAAGGCFDTAGAVFPIRVLPLARVIDPLPVSHAPERIEQYRLAMERGDRFPPIAVVRWGRRFLVADGHKRFSAYKQLARHDDIVVEVWTLRRWLRDQLGQLRRKTRQQLGLLRRSRTDPQARRDLGRLAWDTAGHWRRMAQSLRRHWQQARGRARKRLPLPGGRGPG
jgi:hypothetical protein